MMNPIRKNILESYQTEEELISKSIEIDILEKGKRATLGEVREHGGKKVIKTVKGWRFLNEGGESSSKTIEQKEKAPEAKKEEAAKTYSRGDSVTYNGTSAKVVMVHPNGKVLLDNGESAHIAQLQLNDEKKKQEAKKKESKEFEYFPIPSAKDLENDESFFAFLKANNKNKISVEIGNFRNTTHQGVTFEMGVKPEDQTWMMGRNQSLKVHAWKGKLFLDHLELVKTDISKIPSFILEKYNNSNYNIVEGVADNVELYPKRDIEKYNPKDIMMELKPEELDSFLNGLNKLTQFNLDKFEAKRRK